MKRIVVAIVAFSSLFLLTSIQKTANAEEIAVIVNNDAITSSDISNRMELIMVSSGLPDTKEMKERVHKQVTELLIDETLKIQEASNLGIDISKEDIDKGISAIASQNNMSAKQFSNMITQRGLRLRSLRNQIRAQIAWSQVIQSKLRPRIVVTERDVDSRLDIIQSNKGQTEYLMSEIFLPIDKNEKEVLNLAQKLVNEIRQGRAPFSVVAQQFSKAAGAAQGGDLGWILAEQLPESMKETVGSMNENSVSNPVKFSTGYHIYALRKKREITDETIPPREQVFNRIGLERLDRMQQRYLLDLKSTAFIENRNG